MSKKKFGWGIALIIFGILAVIGGAAEESGGTVGVCAIIIVIGIILLISYYSKKCKYDRAQASKKQVDDMELEARKAEALARKKAAEAKQRDIENYRKQHSTVPWVCKHCGATTRGDVCEYCDSVRE